MSKTNKSFKQKLDELEETVEWFESSEIDFDQALNRFEKGLELASELKKQLDQVENKVTEIRRKFESADGGLESPPSGAKGSAKNTPTS